MTSQVFYRKWRPQTLREVVGQEHITTTLINALESGRVAHAYLFCGPRGTGKTSTGRILAKAVNCLRNGRGEPCNNCSMCQAITNGSALDVIEIDAASNRGIDDIRDLRERVKFAPNSARYKVYIIDEVHMLTNDASNALLKTLEEPPPHAIFVLATTEPHKVLPTILSRCQRFDFRRLSHSAVVSKLSLICQHEDISIEPQGLKLIARCVSGSLRDAENLLQQLVAYYGRRISVDQIQDMLGLTTDSRIRELVRHIAAKDAAAGLNVINSLVADGLDLLQFNRGVVDYLRNMLLVKSGAEASVDLAMDDLTEVKQLAQSMSMDDIVRALKLFGQIDLRSRDYSALPLELALVESIVPQEDRLPSITRQPSVVRKTTELTLATSVKSPPQPVTDKNVHDTKLTGVGEEKQNTPRVEPKMTDSTETTTDTEGPAAEGPSPSATQPELERIKKQWSKFVNALRDVGTGSSLDAFLRSACEPEAVEGDTLVLAFRHAFHKEKIEDTKNCRMVEKKLAEMFGSPNRIRCILKPKAEQQRAVDSHLVKAVLEMGGRITSVEEFVSTTEGEKRK